MQYFKVILIYLELTCNSQEELPVLFPTERELSYDNNSICVKQHKTEHRGPHLCNLEYMDI